jgi:nitrile hydratase beta subunit
MNGAHDLGGGHGFGPIAINRDESKFHAAWERDAFALTLGAGLHGRWNIDMSRFAREDRAPADYLALPYYGLWLAGLERLAHQAGMLGEGVSAPAPEPQALRARFESGFPVERPGPAPAFTIGQSVRVRHHAPRGHTRVPRYCRGAVGTVLAQRGCHVFPDSNAHGLGEDPRPLYTIRFDASALFGTAAEPNSTVMIDLWEPYLSPE